MYDNIGGKIKGLAKWTFAVEAIAAVICGFMLIVEDFDMILLGLLVIAVGPLVAWAFSWLLYGFGELIDNTDIIARNTRGTEIKNPVTPAPGVSERISKIEDLRSKGLITEEEYQRAISKVE